MNKKIIQILISIYLFGFSKEAVTDCLFNSGKSGEECGKKTTFINVPEWHFIVEDDLGYMCCFYKGKLGNEDYEGCFAFYEEDIKNYKVNDLLNEMERGQWELALGNKCNNPSIDCLSQKLIFNSNKIFFFIGMLIFLL